MKRSLYVYLVGMLAALPAAFVLMSPSSSSALNRRLLAANVCTAGINVSNRLGAGYGPAGVVGNGELSTSSVVACMVPSDTYFPHVATNGINVHVRRNRVHNPNWNLGARACVQSFNADTIQCGNAYFADPAIGEKTLPLTANQLTVWKNGAFSTWGAYVQVTFQQSDLVRFIFSST